ncbi:MAG: leucine-rich repeat domain-containing protein [Ruminococcaceae bacterium]|nr:leucine-rich repeat domain-containing protein [Oscillospiraceae bacterium]
MKGRKAFEAMNNVSDKLITESGEKLGFLPREGGAPVLGKAPKRRAFSNWLNSGWGVAAVCALVSVGVLGGILWAGNQSGTGVPAGTVAATGTEAEATEPLILQDPTEETTAEETASEETTAEETTAEETSDTEAVTEAETSEPHAEHIYGEWTLVQTPTCTEEGVRVRSCTVEGCDATETEHRPAGLHDFENGAFCAHCGWESSPLSFTSNGDGTCYVSGRGTWGLNSYALVIPNYSTSGELVVAIDTADFQEMRRCSKVVLPEGLVSICAKAFYNSQQLAEVNMPAGVTYIGDEAFYNCVLESIALPEGMTHLGAGVFSGNRFKEIYLPASLTHIGQSPLSFSSVETVTFGEGIQIDRIPQGFAMMCHELKEISIPEGVTAIEDFAFWDSGLTAVKHMPEGLTSIGVSAFADCPNLSELSLPASLSFVGDRAFANAPQLPYEIHDNVCYLPVGDNPYGVVVAPASTEGALSVAIHEDAQFLMGQAFLDCHNLIYVAINGDITTIGDNTFKNCTALRSVSIFAPITSIGFEAFRGCDILRKINLPDTLTSLGENAFYNCPALELIQLPVGITTIENGTFFGCTSLRQVKLSANVTSVGDQAFYQCRALEDISLPKGVTSIGSEAFFECNQMLTVNLPERLTHLGDRAFVGCSSLTQLQVPEGLTEIDEHTFNGCVSLRQIILPDGLEQVGMNAFAYTTALESVSLPNTVTFIDRAFMNSTCDEIHFRGTIAQWEAIGKRARWYGNNENMMIHCTDGDVGVE